jgi:hypothetical protein
MQLLCSYTNIVAASLCRIRVTSALLTGQFEDNEWNVFSNKLMDAINDSKSIKQGDKCHNVSGQTRDQTSVTSPILFLF